MSLELTALIVSVLVNVIQLILLGCMVYERRTTQRNVGVVDMSQIAREYNNRKTRAATRKVLGISDEQ